MLSSIIDVTQQIYRLLCLCSLVQPMTQPYLPLSVVSFIVDVVVAGVAVTVDSICGLGSVFEFGFELERRRETAG